MDILSLLQCLQPSLTRTTVSQLSHIVLALLTMSGRVTMLGIARWTEVGGSYRTVQRWFYTAIPWAQVLWLFFRQHLFHADDVYLLAGDEVVVTKAGHQTYGLDCFFSGLLKKPVPGLAFFALSLVSLKERRAFPIQLEQVVRSAEEKPPLATSGGKPKSPRALSQVPSAQWGVRKAAATRTSQSRACTRSCSASSACCKPCCNYAQGCCP